ncbi:UNVERIFIED_CONTAM: hypothetical protein K2H54_031168 [Gekko kuhli]
MVETGLPFPSLHTKAMHGESAFKTKKGHPGKGGKQFLTSPAKEGGSTKQLVFCLGSFAKPNLTFFVLHPGGEGRGGEREGKGRGGRGCRERGVIAVALALKEPRRHPAVQEGRHIPTLESPFSISPRPGEAREAVHWLMAAPREPVTQPAWPSPATTTAGQATCKCHLSRCSPPACRCLHNPEAPRAWWRWGGHLRGSAGLQN